MAILAFIDVAKLLDDANFPSGEPLARGVAVVAAESGRDPANKNTAGNTPPSTDRGLWMINDYWHPEVSDACAYDAACATREAFRLSKGGLDYGAWAAWNNGSYDKHMAAARVALDGLQRIKRLQVQVAALQAQVGSLTTQLGDAAKALAAAQADKERLSLEAAALRAQVAALTEDEDALEARLQAALDARAAAEAGEQRALGRVGAIETNVAAYLDDLRRRVLG